MFFNCADHLLTEDTEVSKGFESLIASDIAQLFTTLNKVQVGYNPINSSVKCPPLRLLCDFILNTLTHRGSSL